MSEGILLRLRDYVFVACCPRQPQICGAIHGAHIAIQSSLHQYTNIYIQNSYFEASFRGFSIRRFLLQFTSQCQGSRLVTSLQRFNVTSVNSARRLFFFPFSLPSAIDLDVVTIVLSRAGMTFLVFTACFVKTSNSDLGEQCFH